MSDSELLTTDQSAIQDTKVSSKSQKIGFQNVEFRKTELDPPNPNHSNLKKRRQSVHYKTVNKNIKNTLF